MFRRSILDTSIASGPTPSLVGFETNELKCKLEAVKEELNNQRIQNGLLMKKVSKLNLQCSFKEKVLELIWGFSRAAEKERARYRGIEKIEVK